VSKATVVSLSFLQPAFHLNYTTINVACHVNVDHILHH